LFAHVFTGDPWWLGGYLVAFLAGFGALRAARHREHEQKHIDYRALAEAMRVQFYWRLGGSTQWTADHHLRVHRTELDWVRDALRAWSAAPPDAAPGLADVERWELVRRRWVNSQSDWFGRKAEERHTWFERCHVTAGVFLKAGFATAVVLLGLLVTADGHAPASVAADAQVHDVPHYVHVLIVVSAMLMLMGALAHAFGEKMAFEPEADRYRLMQPLFARADVRLGALIESGAFESARRLIEELGREALAENSEWLLSKRERKLEPMTHG
jgi:hypothetical protein